MALLGVGLAALLLIDDDDDAPASDSDTPEDPSLPISQEILGTDGADTLSANGNDTLRGGRGNDRLEGSGNATVQGGAGRDVIELRDNAFGNGGFENDRITAYDNATAIKGPGFDRVILFDNATGIVQDSGDDGPARGGSGSITANDNATAIGSEFGNTLTANDSAEAFGGAGDDVINANDNAQAFGGDGNDILRTNDNATAFGESGNDIGTAQGNSTIFGGEGNDALAAGSQSIGFSFGISADIVPGAVAHVDGSAGDDDLRGRLRSANESVVLTGGTGTDTFIVDLAQSPNGSEDLDGLFSDTPETSTANLTITDFDPETEKIELDFQGPNDISFLANGTENTDVLFRYQDGEGFKILLEGVTPDQMSLDNIVLTEPPLTFFFGTGTDNVTGTSGIDVITLSDMATADGLGDADQLRIFGNSTGFGGAGDDKLTVRDTAVGQGGEGNNRFNLFETAQGFGGAGDDVLFVSDEAQASGGEGNDSIRAFGRDTAATVNGDGGDDTIKLRDDSVGFGGEGSDIGRAAGNSTIFGGTGDDDLRAHEEGRVFGEAGNDTVSAGARAGLDNVVLSGGEGTDLFRIYARDGATDFSNDDIDEVVRRSIDPSIPRITFTDFDPATEVILLEDLEETTRTFADAGGGNVTLTIADDQSSFTVLIEGVTLAQISAANIVSTSSAGSTVIDTGTP
ncbi:MAG: hypothetical protein AAGL23_05735 [Pseudomonadota bacterium]